MGRDSQPQPPPTACKQDSFSCPPLNLFLFYLDASFPISVPPRGNLYLTHLLLVSFTCTQRSGHSQAPPSQSSELESQGLNFNHKPLSFLLCAISPRWNTYKFPVTVSGTPSPPSQVFWYPCWVFNVDCMALPTQISLGSLSSRFQIPDSHHTSGTLDATLLLLAAGLRSPDSTSFG